jgi:hypothetical protein
MESLLPELSMDIFDRLPLFPSNRNTCALVETDVCSIPDETQRLISDMQKRMHA